MKRKYYIVMGDGEVKYFKGRSLLLLVAGRMWSRGEDVKRVMEGADHWRIKEERGEWLVWEGDLGREWSYRY